MKKWARHIYQPSLPLSKDGCVTASDKHTALSLKIAEEGIVLLKNEEQILPLKKGTKIAFFGKGTFDYVKGGGGSGNVFPKYTRNICEGFEHLGLTDSFKPLNDFYKKNVEEQYSKGSEPGMLVEPEVPSDLLARAGHFAEVAIISISRFFFLYIFTVVILALGVSATGLPVEESIFGVASCVSSVGPSFGMVGATGNFAGVTDIGKLIFSLGMLLGRLELFTALALLRSEYWRKSERW